MELKHFKCPSCGANLNISADSAEARCDYCGQSFVVDNPNSMANEAINETIAEIINETIEESNKKQKNNNFGRALIIGIASMVAVISLAMIVLVAVSSKTTKKDEESNEFTVISSVSAEVPSIVVEKDFYTFRTESVRQLNFDKFGKDMGFDSPEAYEEGANELIDDPETLTRIASDGSRIYYNEETNFFVKLYDDGAIRLFISPIKGKDFFENN